MFDATRPETSKIDFNVDLSSATIGSPETDAELIKAAWFNATQFPTARFRSSAVRQLEVGKYQVDGTLSIKGVMRNITVPVSVTQTGANTIASGVFLMKRLDYKIGDNEWGNTSIVADEVQVKFKLMLTSMNNR